LKKLLSYSILFLGGTLALVGTAFVFMYFWEGIYLRIGEPDQSLLFWYLPVLFLGIIGIIGGIAMLVLGKNSLKK